MEQSSLGFWLAGAVVALYLATVAVKELIEWWIV